MQLWAVIVDTFRECRDKKLFWILLFISTIVAAVVACIGFDDKGFSMFFGAVHVPVPESVASTFNPAQMTYAFLSYVIVDTYIGRLGTLACLIATAGIIPTFLQSGAIDVVLGKPMSRPGLFLAKYVGSLSFVFVQAAYFVLLTLVALRIQIGSWVWPYLWAIPLLVAMFSYLYCVCALAAVWSRSTRVSIIVVLIFWGTIAGVDGADAFYSIKFRPDGHITRFVPFEARSPTAKAFHVAKLALPKTGDIPHLVATAMHASGVGEFSQVMQSMLTPDTSTEALDQDVEEQLTAGSTPAFSVGSSLIFEAVVLAVACLLFGRKDF